MSLTLNHRQVYELIKAVGADSTVLVRGHAGIGKTSIIYEMARDPFFANHTVMNPIDCTQMSDGSLLVPDLDRELGVSRELPNERFAVNKANHRGIPGSRPVVIGFDEIGKAKQYIKDMIAPVIYEHRMADLYMPDRSYVVCFTNLDAEGLGDQLQAHMRDRVIEVVMRNPTSAEWIEDFAVPRNLHPVVIIAAREHPQVFESFMDYEPEGAKAGQDLSRTNPFIFNPRRVQDKWVTPRSLHTCSKTLMNGANLDDDTLHKSFAGTVGRAFAAHLMTLVKFGRELPSYEQIVHDPLHVPVPSNAGARVMLAFSLMHKTDSKEHAEAVALFMARMPREPQLLFAGNVSKNSKKLGLFAASPTFQGQLLSQLRLLNA